MQQGAAGPAQDEKIEIMKVLECLEKAHLHLSSRIFGSAERNEGQEFHVKEFIMFVVFVTDTLGMFCFSAVSLTKV